MRLDEVIISKREVELLNQALVLLGKGNRLAPQRAVLRTPRHIVTLDAARVERRAHG